LQTIRQTFTAEFFAALDSAFVLLAVALIGSPDWERAVRV
jgi:hypothetical protein